MDIKATLTVLNWSNVREGGTQILPNARMGWI